MTQYFNVGELHQAMTDYCGNACIVALSGQACSDECPLKIIHKNDKLLPSPSTSPSPPKTLFQLRLNKILDKDWVGTIYNSRLYASREACRLNCATEELWDIAETLTNYFEAGTDIGFDAEVWESQPVKTKAVKQYLNRVSDWLQEDGCPDSLLGDCTVSWEIMEFKVN